MEKALDIQYIGEWLLAGNLGHLFSLISMVAALFAAIGFYKAVTTESINQNESQSWQRMARIGFYFYAFSVIAVIFILFFLILNHRFEYKYVWQHSSRSLPVYYMISCFWEGQEGSFLLWQFWTAFLGLLLIRVAKTWENRVMSVVSLLQGFNSEIFFNLTDKIGFASLIEVDPAHQEHGLGKHLMRNQIEYIYGIGMKSVHMRAAMSAGGYAWGKFGLEPTDLRTDQTFKDIVQKQFGAIRPLLSREEIAELAPLTILSCREDVWALSQSSIELGPRLIDVFDEARGLK